MSKHVVLIEFLWLYLVVWCCNTPWLLSFITWNGLRWLWGHWDPSKITWVNCFFVSFKMMHRRPKVLNHWYIFFPYKNLLSQLFFSKTLFFFYFIHLNGRLLLSAINWGPNKHLILKQNVIFYLFSIFFMLLPSVGRFVLVSYLRLDQREDDQVEV